MINNTPVSELLQSSNITAVSKCVVNGRYIAKKLELYKKHGIYLIVGNFDSDSLQYPIYIGSSVDLQFRVKDHLKSLNNGLHKNSILQRSWTKNNGNFDFFILEFCEYSETIPREQYYLNEIRPFLRDARGFNIERLAKRMPHDVNRSPCKEESKAKIGKANSKPFQIISPNGSVIKGSNLSEFCRQNGLDAPLLCAVINGRRPSHKGYVNINNPDYLNLINKNGDLRKSPFKLRTPTGETVEGSNIKQFASKNKLCYDKVLLVLNGKRKQHKGYTKP